MIAINSVPIAILMTHKNIGLQANILDTKVFTIFVVMALVTTVATTPLTRWLYPPWYRKKLEQWKRGEIDWDGKPLSDDGGPADSAKILQDGRIRRLLVYLRLDSLPSLFTIISLLGEEHASPANSGEDTTNNPVIRKRPLEVHALRILELTERTSSVMKVTEGDDYSRRDPVVNAFRTFSQLHEVAVSGTVAVAAESSYAQTVVTQASDQGSDFVLIPWSEVGSNTEDQSIPFSVSSEDRFSGRSHLDFIQGALSAAVCNTGIFIGNRFGGVPSVGKPRALTRTLSGVSLHSQREAALPPVADRSHHVFLPFIGGADDRAALRFVLQLARNPHVTATIAHLIYSVDVDNEVTAAPESLSKEVINAETTAQDSSLLALMRSSLPAELSSRVKFTDATIGRRFIAGQALELAKNFVGQNPRNAGDIVVVGRRHAALPPTTRQANQPSTEYEMQKTIGVLGEKVLMGSLKASVLVIQAAGRNPES